MLKIRTKWRLSQVEIAWILAIFTFFEVNAQLALIGQTNIVI